MSRPVVHFEIVGARPAQLRRYYGDLFGWQYDVGDAATEEVSRPGEYGFVADGAGINGGVCGGDGFTPHVLFYVGVPDVEAALREAERLGGRRFSATSACSITWRVSGLTAVLATACGACLLLTKAL